MPLRINRVLLFFLVTTLLLACKSEDKEPKVDLTLANKQAVGSSSEAFLRDTKFKSVIIEIVYANGFKPEEGTINRLLNLLEERLNKPQGITVVERMIQPNISGNSYTINNIVAIEDEFRSFYNTEDQLAVYAFFSNKKSSNDTQTRVTLGSAYRNTSVVVYKKTINDIAASQGINIAQTERNTLNHEFGHLLGMVNLQLDDIHTVHEDAVNSKHCLNEECLMYFQTTGNRNTIINSLIRISTDKDFDSLCIEDLQAKGGK